jgi:hypothetical protein
MSGYSRVLVAALLSSACVSLGGCNLNKFAADQTASVIAEAAPALDAFWDYEVAGIGTPGAIMQLEAMLSVSPNNEVLALNLAKAYLGYSIGWVENDFEVAYAAADFDKADRLRQRARLLYLRARNLALRSMRNRDKGVDEAIKGGADKVAAYLKEHYTDAEDVGPVAWAGLAWGAAINMSLDQPDLIADLPIAKEFVRRAVELDGMYFNAAGYLFLGSMEAAFPPALGGDPEKGKVFFEKALELTKRKNHMIHINYARIYAVNTQNRELYVSLLNEIINSGDQGNHVRLNNKIARVRAERYLTQTDELF